MVRCLSPLFCIQKIWSFLMFIATFRTQRNWSFPCFLTLLYSKNLVFSHVYWNSKTSKSFEVFKEFVNFPVSRHSLYMCVTKMLTFRIQKIWSFPCFLTLLYVCYEIAYFPYSKDLVVSHVYRHISYSKELVVSMFLDTFVVKGFGRFSCL